MVKLLLAIGVISAALSSPGASAQPAGPGGGNTPQTSIVGSFSVKYQGGGGFRGDFSCLGTPRCAGIFTVHDSLPGCSNTYVHTERIVIDGLDLSKNGPFAASMTLSGQGRVSSVGSGQVCTFNDTGPDLIYLIGGPYTDGAASFVSNLNADPTYWLYGSFTTPTANPPVFPMDVFGDLEPLTVSGAVTVAPRLQDVGKPQNIYIFAHAPASLVRGAHAAKRDAGDHVAAIPSDDAIVCVLAQVTESGQLVAVSASTMQAALSNVLGSQGQAISVLNSVPTGNVAGAIMFAGYGKDAATMLANGIYQASLGVPGPVQCTSSLAAPPAPKTFGPLTGLWWNDTEPGWGIHFTQRSNIVVATWYTYDSAGNPKWYIAPNCSGPSGPSGSCTGDVYQVSGPTFFGVAFTPISASQVSKAGTLTVNFSDASNASMNFTVAGVTRAVAIKRQVFPVAATSPPAIDYTDLWWNPNESGWGMAITQQYGNIFLAWYVYDSAGKPFWYVASNCVVSGSSCSGTLYRTTSAPFGPTYDTSLFKVFTAGSAIVSFIDANNAVLSYTVDGVSSTKAITRQIFP